MRHLAIGDIHGCFAALTTLAEFVPFRPDDVVITLGDVIDRGPDSRAVLDWLIAYQRRGTLVALRGNHEVMMLQARDDPHSFAGWVQCGGQAALSSYATSGGVGRLEEIPESHWQFVEEETRAWFETETHFFVHANALPDYALEDQPDFILYWEKFDDPPPHESGKVMVCGHTPQISGRPRTIGHAVCIDTGACRGGWLTCLDAGSGRYWLANQRGETRTGWLDDEG
jgi:serine/threonine protein phosphatase 1